MQDRMPYTFGIAQRFGYATDYHALLHPSLPNYIAIAGGDSHGITDDGPPSAHPVPGTSVFGQAIASGRTAAVFAEGMPSHCATTNGGERYAVKHNPWAYFADEADLCRTFDVPVSDLDAAISAGTLPNAGMVVPDTCHDAHDCDLSVADDWFRCYLEKIFAGPDWQSGHLAVILTADEDDRSADNKVLTVVIHPSQHGHVVGTRLDHYALTRLYEDVVQAPHLKNAEGAASMSDAFGLPLR
nr:alkaline phosphatase family protein [Microlunatus panaciterrae]